MPENIKPQRVVPQRAADRQAGMQTAQRAAVRQGKGDRVFSRTIPLLIVVLLLSFGVSVNMHTGRFDFSTGATMLLGGVAGALIAYGKLPPFIATLGTMKIFRSVTQQMTQTFNPSVPAGFKTIASARIGNQIILPILYWVIMVVIMHIIFRKTAFGRQTIAVGSNEKAAKLSGINVAWVKMKVYALGGVMCAIGAIIYIARIGSMDFANAGSGYEMDAIAAVVVGGTSMAGGKGSLVGAFVGMLIIGVMNNILNTVGVPTFLCEAVKGLIIIFAVLLQKKDSN